jgi:transposase
VSDRNGVSRGDRNRNARLARLRAAVPLSNVIVGIDLADVKQMVVVTDHESRVLARRTFRRRAWDLGVALDWAAGRAAAAGFAGVTVAVEPTGHRWRVISQLAAERQMLLVCVQPLMSSWARRAEDLTFDKTDDKDAVLIARLTAQLRCYLPEPADETWARLRHLGIRRARLIAEQTAQVQQMRDLLECGWPAALEAARQPFKSTTWHAAVTIALSRADGDLGRVTRLGRRRFDVAVRRQVARWDAVHPWQKIIDGVFAACASPAGVTALRRGALERVALLLADWRDTRARLADTEQRMVTVLGELGLAGLATSITGLSAVGAASILAEAGDPRRFATGRALVKHSGLAPRQKSSGSYAGRTRTTGQGRPGLRLAAWRAVWGAEVQSRLRRPVQLPDQPRAQQAIHRAGARRSRRSPAPPAACRHHHRAAMGSRHRRRRQARPAARRLTPGPRRPRGASRPGRAPRGIETCNPSSRRTSWAAPPRRHDNPITRCRAPSP